MKLKDIYEDVTNNNLYHFTSAGDLDAIIDSGGLQPTFDDEMGNGVSLTRNKNLRWMPDTNNIRLVFNKTRLKHNFKIKPYHWFNSRHNYDGRDDYRKYGDNIRPVTNQDIPANQFEERLMSDKIVPIKYIERIDIIGWGIDPDELAKTTNIPILDVTEYDDMETLKRQGKYYQPRINKHMDT